MECYRCISVFIIISLIKMGCTSSSNSVHQPSKHKVKDIIFETHKTHSSISTIAQETIGKVSISVSELVLVLRYDFSDGDTVLKKGDLVRVTEGMREEKYWSLVSTNIGSMVHVPNSYLAKSGSLQLCE